PLFQSSRLLLLGMTLMSAPFSLPGEDGYRLWLRYEPVVEQGARADLRAALRTIVLPTETRTQLAIRDELQIALGSLLGEVPTFGPIPDQGGHLIVGTPDALPA